MYLCGIDRKAYFCGIDRKAYFCEIGRKAYFAHSRAASRSVMNTPLFFSMPNRFWNQSHLQRKE